MELLTTLFDLLLHIDQHLIAFVAEHGPWIYLLLAAIIFAETGLVVMPWLPGDSLLFVVGALAGLNLIDYPTILLLLMAASFAGDNTNYVVGRFVGLRLISRDGWLINQSRLDYTTRYYEAHGGKTVIIARFLPIVRTFAPFVAGVARMAWPRFAAFSSAGSLLWVGSLVTAGYLFGNIPWVKQNLTLMILAIIVVSLLPGAIGYLRHRRAATSE